MNMIRVRSQVSDSERAMLHSEHRPTFGGLRKAYYSFQRGKERWEISYRAGLVLHLWMEYDEKVLDPVRVKGSPKNR